MPLPSVPVPVLPMAMHCVLANRVQIFFDRSPCQTHTEFAPDGVFSLTLCKHTLPLPILCPFAAAATICPTATCYVRVTLFGNHPAARQLLSFAGPIHTCGCGSDLGVASEGQIIFNGQGKKRINNPREPNPELPTALLAAQGAYMYTPLYGMVWNAERDTRIKFSSGTPRTSCVDAVDVSRLAHATNLGRLQLC